MNQNAQRQPVAGPAPMAPVTTPAEARKLAETLLDAMNALLAVIERETELVRAGNIRESIKLELQKNELSQRYIVCITMLKASQNYLTEKTPELLTALRRHHDVFRAMLQVNLTVLATAHAVSEGIVRGVNLEMQRKNIPQTYNAYGKRAQPGPRNMTPIAVSRSL
jgi:hypothetical protein